jgi:hypothetical protein
VVKHLNIWVTAGHCSVTVENGASRQTSANSMPKVIDNMPTEDRQVLLRFCEAVAGYIGQPNTLESRKADLLVKL